MEIVSLIREKIQLKLKKNFKYLDKKDKHFK